MRHKHKPQERSRERGEKTKRRSVSTCTTKHCRPAIRRTTGNDKGFTTCSEIGLPIPVGGGMSEGAPGVDEGAASHHVEDAYTDEHGHCHGDERGHDAKRVEGNETHIVGRHLVQGRGAEHDAGCNEFPMKMAKACVGDGCKRDPPSMATATSETKTAWTLKGLRPQQPWRFWCTRSWRARAWASERVDNSIGRSWTFCDERGMTSDVSHISTKTSAANSMRGSTAGHERSRLCDPTSGRRGVSEYQASWRLWSPGAFRGLRPSMWAHMGNTTREQLPKAA